MSATLASPLAQAQTSAAVAAASPTMPARPRAARRLCPHTGEPRRPLPPLHLLCCAAVVPSAVTLPPDCARPPPLPSGQSRALPPQNRHTNRREREREQRRARQGGQTLSGMGELGEARRASRRGEGDDMNVFGSLTVLREKNGAFRLKTQEKFTQIERGIYKRPITTDGPLFKPHV